jgi:nucleotide-binding universal stress UspA family protein
VVWGSAPSGDVARAIAEHACAWPADVVTIGGPAPAPWSWLRPGPVHQRLLRVAHCAVLVVTPPAPVTSGHRRLVGSSQALPAGQGA